ncbi:MAG TPA: DNA methyltransferase [Pyrinomonadaceae bacterium]|jgi:site-specific DNA-methyltransferase (adenine-specific)|nr:DNA methyltransferase [Pyrinomonadaceae bacterium]
MTKTDPAKVKAPRNRTLTISRAEADEMKKHVLHLDSSAEPNDIRNRVICGDAFCVLPGLKKASVDLLFCDPPYNLNKNFGKERFAQTSSDEYEQWLDSWISLCVPLLKKTASIYICGDWRSSAAIERVGTRYFDLQNRITWEREKGRGAKRNWKNAAEDIWFFTVSDKFTFNVDSVKQRRRVIAPYKKNGEPKDWVETTDGNFRDTHPSNVWTDITVPFWSMPENTDHPTQKPEKLLAKIILASSNPGDLILDPFAGSGTTAVVAQKLGRRCIAVESDEKYCLIAQKRLSLANGDPSIQGFDDGVFWERNSGPFRR